MKKFILEMIDWETLIIANLIKAKIKYPKSKITVISSKSFYKNTRNR